MKNRLLGIVLVGIFLSVSFPSVVSSLPADVVNLSNDRYFEPTLQALKDAKESIWMVMYLISFDPEDRESKVYQLVQELVRAKERGLEIKVILDYRSSYDLQEGGVSYYAYKFLKDAGVDVAFDRSSIYTHNKTIVIDKELIIAGSANWSKAALEKNNETSFLIRSGELARQILDDISKVELVDEEVWGEDEEGLYVCIPCKFMAANGIAQEMLRRHDERSFDAYLMLLRDFDGDKEGKVETDYERIAGDLDLVGRMDRVSYRRQINRTMRNLARRYKLIEFKTEFDRPFQVRLVDSDKGLKFKLPREYWEYGWDKGLDFKGKICLLINLAEMESKEEPWEWLSTREQLAEKYGISTWAISHGMMSLRRYNIIEVGYGEIDRGYEERVPTETRYLGLYDMKELEGVLERLEDMYGKDLVREARECASIVYKGYDVRSIEDVIELMGVYGREKVRDAFRIVEMKAPDNPKRRFGYVVGILRKGVGVR